MQSGSLLVLYIIIYTFPCFFFLNCKIDHFHYPDVWKCPFDSLSPFTRRHVVRVFPQYLLPITVFCFTRNIISFSVMHFDVFFLQCGSPAFVPSPSDTFLDGHYEKRIYNLPCRPQTGGNMMSQSQLLSLQSSYKASTCFKG